MKKLIVFSAIILLLIAFGLAYLGLIPGTSTIFAKQKDLGITPNPALVDKINSDLGREVDLDKNQLPFEEEPIYSGKVEIDNSFSDVEVTSVLDSWSKNWSITPFYNVQVKFSESGQAEASGILKIAPAINLAKKLGYSDSQIETASKYASFVSGDLPFYLSGSANVENNSVQASISNMKIGNITVPNSIANQVVSAVEDAIERRINQVPNLNIQSLDHGNGKLNIKGLVPEKEMGGEN